MFSIKFPIEGSENCLADCGGNTGPFHHKSIIGKVPKAGDTREEGRVSVSSSVWCQYVYFAKPEQAGNIKNIHI